MDPPDADEPLATDIQQHYGKALGEIRHIADCTRPDIAFATAALARALTKPTYRHWKLLKRLAQYLNSTNTHGITFPRHSSNIQIQAHSDADFANDTQTRKSFSGMAITLNGGTIHWQAKQQAPTRRRKCIDIKYHYIQDTVRQQAISIHRVPTQNMPADLMTKPLARTTFRRHLQHLRIEAPPTTPTPQTQHQHRQQQAHPVTFASGGL